MLTNPCSVKLLGYLKIYIFDRKCWFICWKFQFFLTKGGIPKANAFWINQKTQKSTGSWSWAAPDLPSHTLYLVQGPLGGETLSRVRRDMEHPLVSSQNCCRLCGDFQEAETGQYFYDCLFEECCLGSAATTAKEEVWRVHLQAKSWTNSAVIFTNGSKLAFPR